MPTSIKRALSNLARNWTVSLPTIIVITLVLTMIQGLIVLEQRGAALVKELEQKFSITVYLKEDADSFQVGTLISSLEARREVVKPVTYTSKEDAWKIVSESFGLKPDLLKSYKFSLPASITINLRSPKDIDTIRAFLQTSASHLTKDPLAGQGNERKATSTMAAFINEFKENTITAAIFFIVFFAIGGALLMSATIHLAIQSRHREITIMKLVGSSYPSLTLPFVVEGFIVAVSAFLLHLLLVFLTPLGGGNLSNMQLNALIFEGSGSVLLGVMVSHFTARMYIMKKSIFP